jgi:predicted Zn-dependent protease
MQDGTLVGEAYFIEFDGNIFRILGYSTPAAWSGYQAVFRRSAQSFDRLTDPSALNVQPLRLTIVTTDRAMTLDQFSTRYPSDVDIGQLELLNRRSRGETIPAGTRLKRVVGGPVR